jgi:AP-1 complex subunit beta-1
LATVVQGQQAENLLDFDDDEMPSNQGKNGPAPTGLGGLDELMADASLSSQNQTTSNAQSQKSQLNDLLGL